MRACALSHKKSLSSLLPTDNDSKSNAPRQDVTRHPYRRSAISRHRLKIGRPSSRESTVSCGEVDAREQGRYPRSSGR